MVWGGETFLEDRVNSEGQERLEGGEGEAMEKEIDQ